MRLFYVFFYIDSMSGIFYLRKNVLSKNKI